MNTITFSIDESTGNTTFLIDADTLAFCDETSTVARASNVEPVSLPLRLAFRLLRACFGDTGRVSEFTRRWECLWRINLSPVDGPIIPIDFASRQSAIDFEINWLEENFL